jgi:hypothetical protein
MFYRRIDFTVTNKAIREKSPFSKEMGLSISEML